MRPVPAFVDEFGRHRELTFGLVRRELFSQFAGSAFGIAWALLHPLLQMFVYMAIFTWVFGMRFGDGVAGGLDDYPAYVLSGLISWMTWSSLLGASCWTVTGSASLVRQADFPAGVLPLRTMLANLVPHAVSLVVLMLYVVVSQLHVPWTWALLPFAVGLQALAMLGVAYLLGALCVFVRDVKEIVTVFNSLGIFLTPALYVPSSVASMPPVLRWILVFNPFSHFVYMYRDCLFWQRIEHPWSWVVCALLALLAVGVGHRVFTRLRIFFGNFL
ncbi:MAG: ABC transporter permease [Planctomycetes bacterium]|nr:ABC transporter permease [Planctomycetota bacterium]